MEKIKKEILEAVNSDNLSDNDWKNISSMIDNKQFILADESDFWECIYIITNAFQGTQCQNISVMSDVLRLAFLKNYYGNFLDTYLTTETDHRNILPFTVDFQDIFSVPCNNLMWWSVKHYVIDTLLTGNVEFFKLLLNFGANIVPPPDMLPYYTSVLEHLSCTYGHFPALYGITLKRHIKSEEFKDKNRLFLFTINIDIVTKMLDIPEIAKNVGRAARILFKSLPFRRITNWEMRLLLEKLLQGLPGEQSIDKIVKDYEHYFPESADPCAPRSLQDLCRCRIRESLRTAKTISYGVPLLPLPKFLKKFILFEIEEY